MSSTYRAAFGGTDSSRRLSCSLILVLGGILFASGSTRDAQASCGDWLAHPVAANPLLSAAHGGFSLEPPWPTASEGQEDPFRCPGPFCDRARDLPIPAAPLRGLTILKDDGCLAAVRLDWLSGVAKAELDLSKQRLPQGHPQRIERPPRP